MKRDRLQFLEGQQPVRVADEHAVEAVQALVAVLLRAVEVVARVHRHVGDAAPDAPDAQGDLLRHRAARHEDRRLLAEQRGDLRLEAGDEFALAVGVGRLLVRVGQFGQLEEHLPGVRAIVVGEEAGAALEDAVGVLRRARLVHRSVLRCGVDPARLP